MTSSTTGFSLGWGVDPRQGFCSERDLGISREDDFALIQLRKVVAPKGG